MIRKVRLQLSESSTASSTSGSSRMMREAAAHSRTDHAFMAIFFQSLTRLTRKMRTRRIAARNEATRFMRSEEHTSELQSLMRISYAVFCLNKKKQNKEIQHKSQLNPSKSTPE